MSTIVQVFRLSAGLAILDRRLSISPRSLAPLTASSRQTRAPDCGHQYHGLVIVKSGEYQRTGSLHHL